jgi:hypothetical protein
MYGRSCTHVRSTSGLVGSTEGWMNCGHSVTVRGSRQFIVTVHTVCKPGQLVHSRLGFRCGRQAGWQAGSCSERFGCLYR